MLPVAHELQRLSPRVGIHDDLGPRSQSVTFPAGEASATATCGASITMCYLARWRAARRPLAATRQDPPCVLPWPLFLRRRLELAWEPQKPSHSEGSRAPPALLVLCTCPCGTCTGRGGPCTQERKTPAHSRGSPGFMKHRRTRSSPKTRTNAPCTCLCGMCTGRGGPCTCRQALSPSPLP